jgi:hypothetical protein
MDHMNDADQRLSQRDAPRGYSSQKAALEGLDQLKRQMQQAQQQGGGGGGLPMPMMAGDPGGETDENGSQSTEKIEIPDQDQFQGPKELRKDLMDAMKQGTPDRYRDQVKQYYEELVK